MRWKVSKHPFKSRSNAIISRYCTVCQEFTVPLLLSCKVVCSCCGAGVLRHRDFSKMNVSKIESYLSYYEILYRERPVANLLQRMDLNGKVLTTREALAQCGSLSPYYHRLLQRMHELQLIKRTRTKKHGKVVVLNQATEKGLVLKQLAEVYRLYIGKGD